MPCCIPSSSRTEGRRRCSLGSDFQRVIRVLTETQEILCYRIRHLPRLQNLFEYNASTPCVVQFRRGRSRNPLKRNRCSQPAVAPEPIVVEPLPTQPDEESDTEETVPQDNTGPNRTETAAEVQLQTSASSDNLEPSSTEPKGAVDVKETKQCTSKSQSQPQHLRQPLAENTIEPLEDDVIQIYNSASDSPIYLEMSTSVPKEAVDINKSQKAKSTKTKHQKKNSEGVHAVRRSPYRDNIICSIPIKSEQRWSKPKTAYDDPQQLFSEYEYDSPPSPAPCDEELSFYSTYGSPEKSICSDCQSSSEILREIEAEADYQKMQPIDENDRKVIIEFCHLLEKSKQLFNGLRELPQYGHKQWHSYFGRTFDVYTKLWKFQQRHRDILDAKYGLQRWQIGEIASKIGQLYYHFYLRTSESAYLNEAFSFYEAIRNRSYYTQACKEDKCELMVKKLRYYARFIVVCLLLKKMKIVKELIAELDRQIYEYGMTYNADDQVEWTVVVDEVKAFILEESVVTVIHPDNCPLLLSHRLGTQTSPQVECSSHMSLYLHEVLIVGSSTTQVKFSELTMDMFRMLQTLEREPSHDVPHLFEDSTRQHFPTPSATTSKAYNLENNPRSDNPHKYLLFKPTPSQILVYLASGCSDLPPNGALLLYISADGQIMQPSKHSEDAGYDVGGLITTSKNDIYRDYGKEQKSSTSRYKEAQCIHPGDLYPFTRRPMFIIVDSDNSYVFQNIPKHFGQPLVVFMSPLEMPASLRADRRQQGSLFTLFLHSPLTAFCYICDIHTITLAQWDRGQAYIDTFLTEAAHLLMRNRIDPMYISFIGDDFLRLLILRYVLCEVTIRMHRAFRARAHLPRASPPMPEDLLDHPALTHIIIDLSSYFQVRGHFHDPSASGPSLSRE